MSLKRAAGILLHPTSLPGKFGIGDLGPEAYKFVDFMVSAGQTIWQTFPLGPTGYGDSPYQCFSAFAGNPLLISPDLLKNEGYLSDKDLEYIPPFNPSSIDYGNVINYKKDLLKKAYGNFRASGKLVDNEYPTFIAENAEWLNDYALFMATKDFHGGVVWTSWSEDIAFRKGKAVAEWTAKLKEDVDYQIFLQYHFFKQWLDVKKYANDKGIELVGDCPIFIAYDSADLWANKELFSVDEKGKLETCAGVPPDYFSETGQLWGNPLYRWDVMEKDNFKWWQKRILSLFKISDVVRIDHFRGFEAFWEIPGDAVTAQKGRWVKAPGDKLFSVIRKNLGTVPIIAEDLGIITKEVAELRDKYEFPGIRIMQFAFGPDGEKRFLPHNFDKNCVVHTGSHDNDTTRGFFDKEKQGNTEAFRHAQKYLDYYSEDMTFQMIKAAYSSVANTVVIPMQDMLNLGTEARMNFPGKLGGCWAWRFTWDMIPHNLASTYAELAKLYERPKAAEADFSIEVEEK